ncbi:eCIS core domain-containing protein [Streptomyces phaeochromogenes]|uniref:eCIS core domain-containing protein n=1 Tax=Streptomyces phaeochromogenes TaxID=1923 RepID=UPI003710632D
MSGNSQTQDGHSEQAAEERRRKRKERAAKSRTPEPKDIVSGAGQPLDVGVRRELEEQLGHDLSRVRLHTGRDAGQLTELLGADAVAVGQDIFFREGAYRPGTADGQRLLAHELLHTVQNPDGLGALRAGRDPGAVSLPQQAIEREAESAAQDLVRPAAAQESAPEVEEGQATPGWLRYATVDADRNRLEQIDPATLVDRLTNSVVRSLRGDPEDRSKRTRRQLARLPEELLDGVLDRLEDRLLGSERDRVLDLVEEIEADGDLPEETDSYDAPAVEPDAAEELRVERESEQRSVEEDREEERKPGAAPGPEKEPAGGEGAAGSTPENSAPGNGSYAPGGDREPSQGAGTGTGVGAGAEVGKGSEGAGQPSGGRTAESGQQAETGGKATAGSAQGEAAKSEQAKGEKRDAAGEGKAGKDDKGAREDKGAKGEKEPSDGQEAPAAGKEESAAKNRPGAVDALVAGQNVKPQDKAGQPKPTGSPTATGKGGQQSGPLSRLDGVRNQDLEGPEETAGEDPFGSGSESEVEVGGGEKSAWDIKLQPEDFIPEQDPDVSGIPTADEADPASAAGAAVPSSAAPPVTKADKVQAERDAEDVEDAEAESESESEEGDASGVADTEAAPEGEGAAVGDGQLGGLALEQAAAPPPVPGSVSKDPKSGADPKAGPVSAQTAVQEAPGRSEDGGEAQETAAKEEKGTPAAGDKSAGAQEKASPQAGGAQSGGSEASDRQGQGKSESGQATAAGSTGGQAQGASSPSSSTSSTGSASGSAAGKSEPTSDASSASSARDSQVSGGSSGGGAQSQSSGGGSAGSTGSGAQAPAVQEPAPAAPEPVQAPEPSAQDESATVAAPSAKAAAAPKAAKSASAAKGSRGGGSGGGGGRGGGSAAVPAAKGKGKKDSGPAPNLSQVSPEAGLSTASSLKPHKALEAMGGVGGSVDRTVGDEHKALAAAPPSMQRPAGAPQTLQGKPKADAPAQYSQDPAQKSEAPEEEKAEVKGAKEPEGQIEAEKAEEPGGWDTFKMALGFGIGWLADKLGFEVDAQELAAKFAGLPTKDEALKQAQAGNAPGVELQGEADQTAGEQGAAVDTKGQETVTTGRDDAARPMGENQVYPDVPKEQLKAKVPGPEGGKGGVPEGGASTGAVPAEAASEVAEHDRGPQFKAAFSDGQKGMSEGRQTKDRDFRDSQAKHRQKVDAEVAANTESQTGEREKALSDVTAQRADWRKEQDEELKNLGTKKSERHDKVRKDVQDKEKKTDDDVDKEKKDGDKKIQDENTKAEQDAEKKRDDSVNDSGNWISKAFDWIKEKVLEIKNAIVRVIKAARDAVVGFIKNFKETVERWINEARKFIVDAIKNLIDDLIEFAKALVRGIIELANRIRKFISGLISAAIAMVNRLAKLLKQIITDLLHAIGKLLGSILSILKKMLLDVIKAVIAAVKTVLEYASKILGALGEFMMIAVDFLSDPGGWLSGAKNSAVDGAKNHLFREVQAAVKQWFQSKIEEILGIPKAMIDKLIKGGFTLERIVKETWDAIVPQLPFIIGEIVITKVIAKLIPGAGWVMAVIDAIRTAIGALSEILRAIGAVITWLKAVRQGGAGILFAKAVAAGIVALLELAYEFLLNGIGKYVAKVGRRLKSVALNLGKEKPGGGRGPAGQGGDDRGGDKKPRPQPESGPAPTSGAPTTRPTTTRPTTSGPTTSRPTTSRPTTAGPRPGGTPNAKNPGTTTPAKPTSPTTGPAKDGTKPGPGTAKTPADTKNPTAKDKNGKPKDKEDDRPDTRPTPSPKPKPQPTPRPKPKPEPDTRPRPKDDTPGKPKEDQGSTTPKTDDKTPDKPKDQDPNGPAGKDGRGGKDDSGSPRTDKDAPGKPKPDKDGKKPGKSKDGDGKKSKHSKDNDGMPNERDPGKVRQDKHEKKDQRKQEEDSKESKDDRLRKIVARIRPRIEAKLREGIATRDHAALLEDFRSWYRLTRLYKQGGANFDVQAVLNPQMEAADGVTEDGIDRDKPLEFPESDNRGNFVDGVLPKSFKHDFINKKWSRGGQYPPGKDARLGILGFRHLLAKDENDEDLREPRGFFQWDAMHLLPRELGGPAGGSNFVPAYNHINRNFYSAFEEGAAKAFGQISKGDKPGYYQIDLSRFEGPSDQYEGGIYPAGFPKTLQARWATYEHKGEGSGKNRSEWKPETEVVSAVLDQFPEPPTTKRPLVNVNTDRNRTNLKAAFAGTNDDLVLAVFKLRPFSDVADMQKRIGEYIAKQTGKPLEPKYLKRMKNNFNRIFTLS